MHCVYSLVGLLFLLISTSAAYEKDIDESSVLERYPRSTNLKFSEWLKTFSSTLDVFSGIGLTNSNKLIGDGLVTVVQPICLSIYYPISWAILKPLGFDGYYGRICDIIQETGTRLSHYGLVYTIGYLLNLLDFPVEKIIKATTAIICYIPSPFCDVWFSMSLAFMIQTI